MSNKTPEQITEARDWASDCVGLVGTKMGADRAVRYVEANYPGGWDAFVAECCAESTSVDMTQYRLTAPGGYEEFYSDGTRARDDFRAWPPGTVMWKATPGTDERWVEVSRKAGRDEFPVLRDKLRFTL